MDKVPASTLILEAEFKVIVLDRTFTPVEPEKFLIAPSLLIPEPLIVIASGIDKPPPTI
jgi:hypothetical protein